MKRFPAAVRPANHLSLSLSLPNLSRSYDDDDRGQRLIYRIKRRTIALQVRDFLPLLRMCVNIREGGLFLSFPPDRQIRVTRRVATFHRSLLQFQSVDFQFERREEYTNVANRFPIARKMDKARIPLRMADHARQT